MSSTPSAAPRLPVELRPSRCQRRIERGALALTLAALLLPPVPWPLRLFGLLCWLWALRAHLRPQPRLRLFHEEALGLALAEPGGPPTALDGCHLHWLGRGLLILRLHDADGRVYSRVLCGRELHEAPLPLLKRLAWPGKAEPLTLK